MAVAHFLIQPNILLIFSYPFFLSHFLQMIKPSPSTLHDIVITIK